MKGPGTLLARLERSMQEVAQSTADDCAALRSAALEDIEAGLVRGSNAFPGVRSAAQRGLGEGVPWKLGMGFVVSAVPLGAQSLHWWFRPVGDQPSRPLLITSQPAMIDYYDYKQSDWWQDALSDEQVHISEPYMDAAGTNAYVITGSLALKHGGSIVGVAVIDVEIGELQARWQGHLMQFDRTTCVVSEEGAVIATNSGRLLGENIDLGLPAPEDIRRVGGTPWAIVHF